MKKELVFCALALALFSTQAFAYSPEYGAAKQVLSDAKATFAQARVAAINGSLDDFKYYLSASADYASAYLKAVDAGINSSQLVSDGDKASQSRFLQAELNAFAAIKENAAAASTMDEARAVAKELAVEWAGAVEKARVAIKLVAARHSEALVARARVLVAKARQLVSERKAEGKAFAVAESRLDAFEERIIAAEKRLENKDDSAASDARSLVAQAIAAAKAVPVSNGIVSSVTPVHGEVQ